MAFDLLPREKTYQDLKAAGNAIVEPNKRGILGNLLGGVTSLAGGPVGLGLWGAGQLISGIGGAMKEKQRRKEADRAYEEQKRQFEESINLQRLGELANMRDRAMSGTRYQFYRDLTSVLSE